MFFNEDINWVRKATFTEPTVAEKMNTDIVSVIIPVHKNDIEYIERTVKNLYETAHGDIEVIVGWDGVKPLDIEGVRSIQYNEWVGQRKIMNDAVAIARGDYIYRLDAHCGMTQDWDIKLKHSCRQNTIVTTIFDDLDTETWKGKYKDLAIVRIKNNLREKAMRKWKAPRKREKEEETMGMLGTSWMILKDYYNELGGCDEECGKYGLIGTEFALKSWLTGGRVIIRTDVVCYHLFKVGLPYDTWPGECREQACKVLMRKWMCGIENDKRAKDPKWLWDKFGYRYPEEYFEEMKCQYIGTAV